MLFRGSLVALITPFDQKGRLDKKTLEKLVEWHISEGTDGIVCCATTGEGPCLTDSERKKISEICIKTSSQRIPIVIGTGVSSTKMSIRYTEQAQKWGADGCLVVTPYYNKPSARGCFLHFQEVAKVGLPIIIYHNPGRAVVRLSAETIAEISQIPGIVGLKESGADLELIQKIKALCSLPILSGEDDLTFETMRRGGMGAISVIGNLIPKGWKEMIQLSLAGEWEKAEVLAEKYMPLCKALFFETNPQCVKFAMSWLGKCHSAIRLPMLSPTQATQAEIKKALLVIK